jgi:CHAT domain-containing protein/tetratricopeptide (TPR) repeat protein
MNALGLGTALVALTGWWESAPRPRADQTSPRILNAGDRVTREIVGGRVDRYLAHLMAGEFVQFRVRQLGADLALVVHSPRTRNALRQDGLDEFLNGTEVLSFVADSSGRYEIDMTSLRPPGSRGSYTVHFAERRPTASGDSLRLRAEEKLRAATAARAVDSLTAAASGALDAIAAARAASTPDIAIEASLVLGDAYVEQRKFDSATVVLLDVTTELEARSDSAGLIRSHHKVSQAYFFKGDPARAISHLRRALDLAVAGAVPLVTSYVANELGYVLTFRGILDSARVLVDSAARLARGANDDRQLSMALVNTDRILVRDGDADGRIEVNRELATVAARLGDAFTQGIAENNLGVVYGDINEDRQSILHYEAALLALKDVNEPRGKARIHANIGVVLGRTRADSGLRRLEFAFALQERIPDVSGMVASLANIGQILLDRKGDASNSARYLDSAFRLVNGKTDPRSAAIVTGSLAKAIERLGHRDSAEVLLRKSFDFSVEAKDIRTQAIMNQVLASHWDRRGNLDSSRVMLERGLRLWEAIWRNAQGGLVQTAVLEQFVDDYAFYSDVLVRLHLRAPDRALLERAFGAAESARARVFHQAMRTASRDSRSGGDSLLLRRIQRGIDSAAAEYSKRPTSRDERLLDSLLAEYDRHVTVARGSPSGASRDLVPATVSADEVKGVLDPETALLEYQVGRGRSLLWVVTRDTLAAFVLPPKDSLARLVTSLYSSVSARGMEVPRESAEAAARRLRHADREFTRLARVLSDALLKPAAGLLRGRRLAIVPSGVVHFAPFAALPDPDNRNLDPTPLVLTHEIVYLPSASTVQLIRQRAVGRKSPAEREMFVVADPVFSANDPRVASRPGGTGGGRADGVRGMSIFRGNTGFRRLQRSRSEGEFVWALAGRAQSQAAFGFEANLSTLLSRSVASSRRVHISSHAYYNTERPDLSGVVLSQVGPRGQRVDGYLGLHRIYSLDWSSELVVLSACEAGIGRRLDGEGMISLARAFLQAGSDRVVSAQWKVREASTEALMKEFYRGLYEQGLRPAAALRAAQIALYRPGPSRGGQAMSSSSFAHPYYWASFTITGEWQ